MWTDAELVERQKDNAQEARYVAAQGASEWHAGIAGRATRLSELYRLARLGLAAEQVGRWNFQEAVANDEADPRSLEPFLNHEAWRNE